MEKLSERTVGQIVAEDYQAAEVFRKFGLDFCCSGSKTIEEASSPKNVDPREVKEALQNIDHNSAEQYNYNKWALDFLVGYIINNHHEYCRTVLPEINFYAKKVLSIHGQNHPELEEIYYELLKLHAELIEHLDEEEAILFPFVKKLVMAEKNREIPNPSEYEMVANPIAMMEEEHEEAGEAMAKIRGLSDNFTTPQDACTTYHVFFENLKAFEQDLHKHVHLENNILFPKTLKLERRLNNHLKSSKRSH